jgi:hypothetical protein
MVDNIQSLRGLVIVGRPVLSIASLGVVCTAVDGSVLENAGVDADGGTSRVVAYRGVGV